MVYFTQILLHLGGTSVQVHAFAAAAGSCVFSQGTMDDLAAGELSSCFILKPYAECSIVSKLKRE